MITKVPKHAHFIAVAAILCGCSSDVVRSDPTGNIVDVTLDADLDYTVFAKTTSGEIGIGPTYPTTFFPPLNYYFVITQEGKNEPQVKVRLNFNLKGQALQKINFMTSADTVSAKITMEFGSESKETVAIPIHLASKANSIFAKYFIEMTDQKKTIARTWIALDPPSRPDVRHN